MATTIDWGSKVITVNQADLLQVQVSPIEVYELNIDDFRKELQDILDDDFGMPHEDTHAHFPPQTVAGVVLARVVAVINGYTVTFSPDASYGVNIVGGNSNVADVTNPNNVSVRSANSAGLQDSTSLQASAFGDHVTIDVINGVSGTTFPRGTDRVPVDNLADALVIAGVQGRTRFRLVNSMTLNSGTDLSGGFTFYSDRVGVIATIDASADVTNCTFETIAVTGTLDGNNKFVSCEIFNATSLQALLIDSVITGTLTLGGGLTILLNCHSGVAGGGPSQYPTIDFDDTDSDLVVRDYSGGLAVENISLATTDVSLDFDSGRFIVDSTVTDGAIAVRGMCELVDNSTGAAVVTDKTYEQVISSGDNKVIAHVWASSS